MNENSPPAFEYDSIATGYYDEIFKRRRGVQSRWHHDKFARIREELQPGSLLDIGCGPGTFIGTLDPEVEATGVDISEQQIRYAEAHNGGGARGYVVCGEPPIDLPDARYDNVTLIELVEHLTFDHSVVLLKEARRLLKPDGRLLVSTPDYASLWPYLEALVNRLGDVSYEDQHITHFDKPMLQRLLDEAGFAVDWVENYQFLAPFTAALGWGSADLANRLEPRWLVRTGGFLLLARAHPK